APGAGGHQGEVEGGTVHGGEHKGAVLGHVLTPFYCHCEQHPAEAVDQRPDGPVQPRPERQAGAHAPAPRPAACSATTTRRRTSSTMSSMVRPDVSMSTAPSGTVSGESARVASTWSRRAMS